MTKLFKISIVVLLLTFALFSCQKEKVDSPIEPSLSRLYILNSGNFGSNDANLAYLDIESGKMVYDIFERANGKKLGDIAQDLAIFGSKMYIAVCNSKVIFVTDYDGKIISEIKVPMGDTELSPRYFAIYKDKIYVSYYEGYLGQIDTTSFTVKTVSVDSNPEEIVESNGKIFVACSGGMNYPNYGKTVSVVNPDDMSLYKTLDVVDNPMYLKVNSQGDVYLISIGNYADIPATLQKISSTTYQVSAVEGLSPTYMAMAPNDVLYLVCGTYDENWNQTFTFSKYDALLDEYIGDFITDGSTVSNAYYISTDNVGNAYIGSSDYVSTGDMYIYTSAGTSSLILETGGLNPICARLLIK